MGDSVPFKLSSHAAHVTTERRIRVEWIQRALAHPQRIEDDAADPDLRHALAAIPERDDRVLRVIYNPKHEPWVIVTAYFDRGMKDRL